MQDMHMDLYIYLLYKDNLYGVGLFITLAYNHSTWTISSARDDNYYWKMYTG